jgi:hypothetical protein
MIDFRMQQKIPKNSLQYPLVENRNTKKEEEEEKEDEEEKIRRVGERERERERACNDGTMS